MYCELQPELASVNNLSVLCVCPITIMYCILSGIILVILMTVCQSSFFYIITSVTV